LKLINFNGKAHKKVKGLKEVGLVFS